MLTVKTLALWLWFAMTTWVPPAHQTGAWREPEADAAGRYLDFAEDVARVALDPDEAPVPGLADDDETSRARTALLLAAIASYESAYAAAVITCSKLGPGRAKGPFQCEGRCPEVCTDVTHAARVALAMVRQSFEVCSGRDFLDRLAFYTDGVCRPSWARSRVRIGRAERWWRAHPLAWSEEIRDQWGDF